MTDDDDRARKRHAKWRERVKAIDLEQLERMAVPNAAAVYAYETGAALAAGKPPPELTPERAAEILAAASSGSTAPRPGLLGRMRRAVRAFVQGLRGDVSARARGDRS